MQSVFCIVCLLEMPLEFCRYQYIQCQCSEQNIIGVKMQKRLLCICQMISFICFLDEENCFLYFCNIGNTPACEMSPQVLVQVQSYKE